MIIPNFILSQTKKIHYYDDRTSLQHRMHKCTSSNSRYNQFTVNHHRQYSTSLSLSTLSITDPLLTTSITSSSSSSLTSSSVSSNTGITTIPTFEPILNIPSLIVFIFIITICISLQYRISLIDHVAKERNFALQQLRQYKIQLLSNNNSNSTISSSSLQEQIEQYKQLYIKYESLRTIIPGVRIIAPPSIHNNPTIQQEHDTIIQQYINTSTDNKNETLVLLQNTKTMEASSAISSSNDNNNNNNNNNQLTYLIRNGIIFFIAITQILLLLFLLSAPDPMNF